MSPKRLEKESIRRQKVPRPKKRGSFKRRLTLFVIFCVTLMGIAGTFHVKNLKETVAKKFSGDKRWDIPSRVYSDAEYLYPGIDIAQRRLTAKLERLGYRNTGPEIHGPGDFALAADHLDIYLHDFQYPLEKFSGFPIRIEIAGTRILNLLDLESKEPLSVIRLEPEEIATLFDEKMEDRTLITLKEVPAHLLEAIILIEDERYFRHFGIDLYGIARAAVANFLAMHVVQGGSTLTQQLVKNYFLTAKRSFWRKLNEATMAILLERQFSKAEILEAYLNEIYLGQRGPSSVSGVAEAAKHYFAKEIGQLTLSESAMLAGLIRSPNAYSPIYKPEKARARRDLVLKKMMESELISEADYKNAVEENLLPPKPKIKPVRAPYFIDFVKWQLADLYNEALLETEGLKIFTTLDMTQQETAEEALQRGLADLETRWSQLLPKNHPDPLQGCLISMSPQNGYIRVMVGGRDYLQSQFNRCTQAMRQPGSTFKPFVYLTAFDPKRSPKLFTPASLIDDKSFTLNTPQGPWTPLNYDKKEHGAVTLRTALTQSYNLATAQLALQVGLPAIVLTARDAGMTSNLDPVPSLALGAFEVSPLEMTAAYGIFPNKGLKTKPLTIIGVMTQEGTVLERKKIEIERTLDPLPVALTTALLKGVLDEGTAVGARSLGFGAPAAGKTGTTSNYKDAWFIGFTPTQLTSVWVGYDDNTPTQMSGARAALPIWTEFMKKAESATHGSVAQDFSFPKEILLVRIDPDSGKLANDRCPHSRLEYFIAGTEPTERSESCKAAPGDSF